MQQLNQQIIRDHLPPRQRDASKVDFGHVLIIGGNLGFSGAAQMAAMAALRVGAGLVSIATCEEHAALLSSQHPEIMVHGVEDRDDLLPLLERVSAVVLGVGLAQDDWAQDLWDQTLYSDLPMLVDADGLNLLAKTPLTQDNWILTPHVGEAARLLACTREEIQHDRAAAAEQLQQRYGGVVVLKGAGSLVQGKQRCYCPYGNPGMASAGMGDILSGVIGGLLAQKLPLETAAQVGVTLHALAGDKAAEVGQRGTVATDLLLPLRQLANP